MKRPRAENSRNVSRKFACPFYMRNPRKYWNIKSCLGPGWPSVHRVKFVIFNLLLPFFEYLQGVKHREHILRRHKPSDFQCDRCYDNFESRETFQVHILQSTACAIRNQRERITKSQEELLKKRGKKFVNSEERWVEIFKTLFPEECDIPSPCMTIIFRNHIYH